MATAILEDAIGPAVAGQSPRLTAAACETSAGRLHAVARDLGAITEAALLVARSSRPDRGGRAGKRPR